VAAAIIHPKWATDDKAKINFVEVRLNCVMTPVLIDKILITKISFHELVFVMIIKGATFTHESIKAMLGQEIFSTKGGIHEWNGAAAILIIKAKTISKADIDIKILSWKMWFSFSRKPSKSRHDADDCTRKYFMALSFLWFVFL